VDDELNGLTGREFLLRQHGYDVVVTTSGHESLELLQSAAVDAVILDYRMPEMMGDVVAARMKQLKPEVPIMLLSALDRIPPAALRWTDTFLSKDVPPKQFVEAVDDLVAARSPFFSRWLQDWKRRLSA
jgi:CheY-like chemotaxis protein